MIMENKYYTYAYLTINRRPYYIGMGCGDRAYRSHPHMDVCMPDREHIIILKKNLTQEEAWKHEKYMIAILDDLVNKTKGGSGWGGGCPATETRKRKIGDANRGRTLSIEHKRKLSEAKKGKKQSPEAVAKRAKSCQRSITLISPEGNLVTFGSQQEASKYIGAHFTNFTYLKSGRLKSIKGWSLSPQS